MNKLNRYLLCHDEDVEKLETELAKDDVELASLRVKVEKLYADLQMSEEKYYLTLTERKVERKAIASMIRQWAEGDRLWEVWDGVAKRIERGDYEQKGKKK